MMTPQPFETTIENPGAELLESRMKRVEGLLRARIQKLEAQVAHQDELMVQRLARLEEQINDHEARLRVNTEGVTQFKLFAGLASGGSGIMSLVAIIKAFLGS
jgi:hypothetical protein